MQRMKSANQDYRPPSQWTMEGYLYVQEKRELQRCKLMSLKINLLFLWDVSWLLAFPLRRKTEIPNSFILYGLLGQRLSLYVEVFPLFTIGFSKLVCCWTWNLEFSWWYRNMSSVLEFNYGAWSQCKVSWRIKTQSLIRWIILVTLVVVFPFSSIISFNSVLWQFSGVNLAIT